MAFTHAIRAASTLLLWAMVESALLRCLLCGFNGREKIYWKGTAHLMFCESCMPSLKGVGAKIYAKGVSLSRSESSRNELP